MGKFARKNQKELRQEAKRKIKKPRTSFGGVGQSVLDDDRDAGENVDTSDHLHDDADRYNQKKQKDMLSRGYQRDDDDDDSDNQEEVLPIDNETTDEDDTDNGDDGDDEDGLPSRSAWGNKRSNFYHTDFVDKDHGRFIGSDAEEAEEEEREAKELQAKLASELQDEDFGIAELARESGNCEKPVDNQDVQMLDEPSLLVSDVSKLTEFEKLERLKAESPELLDIIADGSRKFQELSDVIQPLLEVASISPVIFSSRALAYLKTKNQLMLGYCQNINFYLSLKAQRLSVDNHPVTRRLLDFRRLLLKLDPLDKLYRDDILKALGALRSGVSLAELCRKDVKNLKPKGKVSFADGAVDGSVKAKKDTSMAGKAKEATDEVVKKRKMDDDDMENSDEEGEDGQAGLEGKRKLTYQISKNKGVVPYRKKEYRNPRVKHRMKYRKAQIRRKGQVQTFKPETKKYGGEAHGIRAGAVRSVKFK